MRGLRTAARIGAMTWSRRVSRAAIVDLSTQCGLEVAPTPVVEALQAL